MDIRRATPDDAVGIAEVHVRSWQAAYRGLVADDFLAGLDATLGRRAERWASDVGAATLDVFVADEDGIVGFASVGAGRDEDLPDHGELQTIYTLDRVWGRGVGHGLHEAAMDALVGRGHSEALLWVLAANERSIAFYDRHGWALDGTEKHESWGDLVLHEVRMVRRL